MSKNKQRKSKHWYNIDLHLHTPASSDYQQKNVDYIDILYRAEARNLSMIAFTDHNTVAGYRKMQDEIKQLTLLEELGRILPEEKNKLGEYHRLMDKILVLPGFEFTATFGFHILAIFSEKKPVREIEHLLLNLNIPPDKIDEGSVTVGASADVLTAYREIDESGGLVIAAHANSTNGVAMRGFPFGGQTKIAYTQDVHLHALEVTDLERKRGHNTAAFFNGTKPEYPRRMHCIQGSDAHRLIPDPNRKKQLGVGDRTTDILLTEVSFEALKELFLSNDFARTRPHRHIEEPAYDFILAAREEGANIIQNFHESMTVRGGKLYSIITDICAFANTNGGTLYIGVASDPKKPVAGITNPSQAIAQLEKEISKRISPPLQCTLDVHDTNGKKIIRILVPKGDDPPYAIDESKIYIRSEAETGMAVRDEIVGLILQNTQQKNLGQNIKNEIKHQPIQKPIETTPEPSPKDNESDIAPRTGVEVVSVTERNGIKYYALRDLRNGRVVNNVTRTSARRLWHSAITKYSQLLENPEKFQIKWDGNFGLIQHRKQGKHNRYDLLLKDGSQNRYFFGVTEDGIHGPWKKLVGQEDDEEP